MNQAAGRIAERSSLTKPRKGSQFFFQVVAQSYERQSLIITTNLEFSQWSQVFGSEQLTGALLDRLTHHAHILAMNGESFRFRESVSKDE